IRGGEHMSMRSRLIFALAFVASSLLVASPAGASSVGCDSDPSSSDIQSVIDAEPEGSVIQLAPDCTYSVTASIMLKDNDALLGAQTTGGPVSHLVGAGQ